MLLFNIWGTPGAGKSTAAADLYVHFKKNRIQAELVGESARRFIYGKGTAPLGDNQFFVAARQWEKVQRLARSGVEVAIADCPLLQCALYSRHLPYQKELLALLRVCDAVYNPFQILIKRDSPFQAENRVQSEAEADALIGPIRDELIPGGRFDLEVFGNEDGLLHLRKTAMTVLALQPVRPQ